MFQRMWMNGAVAMALGTAIVVPSTAQAADRNSAQVSIVTGRATVGDRALTMGASVFEGETVETAADARVELKTQDGSVVRVGPSSKLLLKSAYFGAGGEKKFSAKLVFGRVWTKVSGLMGGGSKFEVETDSAVAGVRGTTFRVDAKSDKSVLMRVYAGSVAMTSAALVQKQAAPQSGSGRTQIKGPTRISENEWEKLVGKMMQLSVGADGTAGEPKPFAAKDDAADEWAAWNLLMDEKADAGK